MTNARTHRLQALGAMKADLVIKNVSILDLVSGEVYRSDIAINQKSGMIVGVEPGHEGIAEIDGAGFTAVPGFIDCHVHVESSMITPMEFDRCVLPHGTTTAVCDPHEMTNVLGTPALDYFFKASEATAMDLMVNISSCVPATPLGSSGAHLRAADLVPFKAHRNNIGAAEVMTNGEIMTVEDTPTPEQEEVESILDAFNDSHIDGHMPAGIHGRAIDAHLACGIANCHETNTREHLQEKSRKGVHGFIRKGEACNDAETLAPEITARKSPFLSLCTDDRGPKKIKELGHIDDVIRTVIAHGADVASTYRAASWSAAAHFGLHKNTPKWKRRGFIGPGWQADIVLLEGDLKDCKVAKVLKRGHVVDDAMFAARPHVAPVGYDSVHMKDVTAADLCLVHDTSAPLPVIKVASDGTILTEISMRMMTANDKGEVQADLANDVIYLTARGRHDENAASANWFVEGMGITRGAIACTIGHDDHNVTAFGATREDMALAINHVKKIGGGFAVAQDGKIVADMPLPVAGLMSDQPFEEVCKMQETLETAVSLYLSPKASNALQLGSFLSLGVIPKLRLSNFGLIRFDPANGDTKPVLVNDQRKAAAVL